MPQNTDDNFEFEDLEGDLPDIDFNAMEANLADMENHLFKAGVAILQAAQTQENVLQTSLEAIQEALEPGSTEATTGASQHSGQLPSSSEQDVSLNLIWQRLDRIEQRLEYLIDQLVPPVNGSKGTPPLPSLSFDIVARSQPASGEWTEKSLKKAYKTLAAVRTELGIPAKTWKLAVQEANALR